jgi:uncharacterized membrane protein
MGWIILILGVALWWAAHLFKYVAPQRRAAMGAKGKGPLALMLLASIVLMVLGYRATPMPGDGNAILWFSAPWMFHLNNLLMLVAIFLMTPAAKKGRLVNGMRHPMLAGFKLWAAAHLLVNGDLASIILFGGLMAWGVVAMIKINRAEPNWQSPPAGSFAMDAAFLAASIVLMGVITMIHGLLGPSPFGG